MLTGRERCLWKDRAAFDGMPIRHEHLPSAQKRLASRVTRNSVLRECPGLGEGLSIIGGGKKSTSKDM